MIPDCHLARLTGCGICVLGIWMNLAERGEISDPSNRCTGAVKTS